MTFQIKNPIVSNITAGAAAIFVIALAWWFLFSVLELHFISFMAGGLLTFSILVLGIGSSSVK